MSTSLFKKIPLKGIAISGFLSCTLCGTAFSQMSPAVGAYGSIWINDGDSVGRVDLSSPTSGTFTMLPQLNIPGTNFSDGFSRHVNTLTDIAWSSDYSTMYAVSTRGRSGSTQYANFLQFDVNTGAGSFLSENQTVMYGGNVNVINSLGYGSDGKLYSGSDDETLLMRFSESTGQLTKLGSTGFYSQGDIVTYQGTTYALMGTGHSGGGSRHLIQLNLADPFASVNLGGLPNIQKAYGLAAIEGVGIYAVDADAKKIYKLDLNNLGSPTEVMVNGSIGLASFEGATAAPAAVPEPTSTALLSLGGVALLLRRRK